MPAHQAMESQPYYLLLLQSSTGKLSDILLPVPEDLDPESFVKAILAAYKLEFGKAKRLYYRCVLLKKPAVSIVTLAKASTLLGSNRRGQLVIKSSIEDQTLTSAMRDPSILANIDPKSFFEEYNALTADTDGRNAPAAAIMVHLARDDTVAARAAGGIAAVAVSFAAKLLVPLVTGN
ncbi:hypothetical protein SLS63_009492 [Diaporthe eres]|uniref:Uncharacterized protein n=1 Tax=Diaporthe eres TaxID=83184 RepID=A0ABR1NZQ5_DIAER